MRLEGVEGRADSASKYLLERVKSNFKRWFELHNCFSLPKIAQRWSFESQEGVS